jgi:adenylate kinase family enzyme/isopentenyldiphosphate isomerase
MDVQAATERASYLQVPSDLKDTKPGSLLEEPADDLQRAGARFARKAAYAPAERSWPDFTYSPPNERREMVRNYHRYAAKQQVELPPLRIMLVGGPSTGKGTIGPMLVQAFRCRAIGVGQLLRSQARANTAFGKLHAEATARGEPLDDSIVFQMLSERLNDSWDVRRNGWLLDGFPRTAAQAKAVLDDEGYFGSSLRPDCIVVLERPEKLQEEFLLGRMTDSATGETYHPRYNPVPDEEIEGRLMWRVDDSSEAVARRISTYNAEAPGILEAFEADGVPIKRFGNARSELETFAEVADFVSKVGMRKLGFMGGRKALLRLRSEAPEEEADSLAAAAAQTSDGVLRVCRGLNSYNIADYFPVLVDDVQVGHVSSTFLEALAAHIAAGSSCELVRLAEDKDESRGGAAAGSAARKATVGVRLAPAHIGLTSRTATVAALVRELVKDGAIPRGKLRNELQDVRPLSDGWVGPQGAPPPLRLERGAMIHFGVPSYGVHVNGWVRNPDLLDDNRPWALWVAKRSMSKATYPGRLDQMVAGGQPSGIDFDENVRKECEEEASLPPEVIDQIRPAGMVCYRYAAKKGLSTKILATYDVEMPAGLTPVCGDGEVEGFKLMKIPEAIASIRADPDAWKPNSALVMIEFAMRYGYLSPDDPGYFEIGRLLRAGVQD